MNFMTQKISDNHKCFFKDYLYLILSPRSYVALLRSYVALLRSYVALLGSNAT